LDAPALPAFLIFFLINRALASLALRETAPGACFLFPADQVILRIREKAGKAIQKGSDADRFILIENPLQMRENTFRTRRQQSVKVWALYPAK